MRKVLCVSVCDVLHLLMKVLYVSVCVMMKVLYVSVCDEEGDVCKCV